MLLEEFRRARSGWRETISLPLSEARKITSNNMPLRELIVAYCSKKRCHGKLKVSGEEGTKIVGALK